jgi:hypothetical protein
VPPTGGSQVTGTVPPVEHGAGDADVVWPVLGYAVHRRPPDPAAGGRVAGLRAGQQPEARRRVRLRAGRRRHRGWHDQVQHAGPPRRRPLGDQGEGRRVHLLQPHRDRVASYPSLVPCILNVWVGHLTGFAISRN